MDGAKSNSKWVLLSVAAAAGGICFVAYGSTFLFDYYKDSPDNPHRGEYLEGLVLSLIFSSPFWLLLGAFATPLKSSLPRLLFLLLRLPAIIVGIAYISVNIFIFAMIFLDTFQGK